MHTFVNTLVCALCACCVGVRARTRSGRARACAGDVSVHARAWVRYEVVAAVAVAEVVGVRQGIHLQHNRVRILPIVPNDETVCDTFFAHSGLAAQAEAKSAPPAARIGRQPYPQRVANRNRDLFRKLEVADGAGVRRGRKQEASRSLW